MMHGPTNIKVSQILNNVAHHTAYKCNAEFRVSLPTYYSGTENIHYTNTSHLIL